MLIRNTGKNVFLSFVTRDEDVNNDRPTQPSNRQGASAATSGSSNSHQPYSPSVLLAGGDNTLNSNSATSSEGMRTLQDNVMDAQGCDFVTSNLSAYLDGELDNAQTRLVGAHLGKCPRCAEIFEALSNVDETIEREWRDSAPLPSSLQFELAVNDIMAALPSVPVEAVAFAAHRVHSRTRWMRFATAAVGLATVLTSLWSSYWLGYTNGRRSIATPGSISANPVKHSATAYLSPASATLPAPRLMPASYRLPLAASAALLHPPRLPARSFASPALRSSLFVRALACP